MKGTHDAFADQRQTQEEMWPGASAVALIGRDWYRDGIERRE